ncbi:MAG: hypothetical protein HC827_18320 [Cyanobacteria bacterium RM1_2_2]|nr:hypothetical protein [Cyanobacteria bacterium RM1_2_2]
MSEQAKDAIAADVAEMMTRYSFDLGGYTLNQWLDQWLQHYPAVWLPGAVIEALYQGRYKAISVWQILDLWRRRGKPLQHFNREFERMVSNRALQLLFSPPPQPLPETTAEPQLVTSEVNGRQIWTQNGRSADSDWRKQTPSSAVLSTLTVATPPLVVPAASIPEADRLVDMASPHPAIEPFKPSEQCKLSLPGEIHRTRAEAAKYPIQQFVPSPASSDFHDKLKAIAQALSMANAQATASLLSRPRQSARLSKPDAQETLEQKETPAPADSATSDPLPQLGTHQDSNWAEK